MEKVIVFGLGGVFRRSVDWLMRHYDIIAISDNYSLKNPSQYIFEVIEAKEIRIKNFDKVIIATRSKVVNEIASSLVELGIDKEKIFFLNSEDFDPFLIDPLFFGDLSLEEKQKVFKNNVELIWIEPNSKCNRQCWFCPNKLIDRHTKNISMNFGLLEKLLKDLSVIDYDGDVSMSYYNEALLDETLEKKIYIIKKYLPNCKLHFNTNGDHITRDKLLSLEHAGLDRLLISNYILKSPEQKWEYCTARKAIEEKAQKLDLDAETITGENSTNCALFTRVGEMRIVLDSLNLNVNGLSRGGLIDSGVPIPARIRVCADPYHAVPISYSGKVMFCVNCHSEAEKHSEYVIGNINEQNIYDIFIGDKMTKLRKSVLCDINSGVCDGCNNVSQSSILRFPDEEWRGRPRSRIIVKRVLTN